MPHAPRTPPLTVAVFKQEIREIDLWCSSCMVAFDAKDPVAVLVGCKRPPHTLVHRIAVHPDHVRKGHGRHLLTSLSAKLAILGPPHLVAEVEAANSPARALFKACGWREARTYVDYFAGAPAASPAPAGLVIPVTATDLVDIALPAADAPRAWERTRGTLLARTERLNGLAITHGERLDAALLYTREADGRTTIWNLSAAPDATGRDAAAILLRDLAHREASSITLPRMDEAEIDGSLLRELGFAPAATTIGFASEATAA